MYMVIVAMGISRIDQDRLTQIPPSIITHIVTVEVLIKREQSCRKIVVIKQISIYHRGLSVVITIAIRWRILTTFVGCGAACNVNR